MKKHILRWHKAEKDNICHLCDYKTNNYDNLSTHLKRKHKILKNPLPNLDQIENIEIIRNKNDPSLAPMEGEERRTSEPAQSVDPDTRREILQRIQRVHSELSHLPETESKTEYLEEVADEENDETGIEEEDYSESPGNDQDASDVESDHNANEFYQANNESSI